MWSRQGVHSSTPSHTFPHLHHGQGEGETLLNAEDRRQLHTSPHFLTDPTLPHTCTMVEAKERSSSSSRICDSSVKTRSEPM